jgi:multiple sugar transport system substrate-binding protein
MSNHPHLSRRAFLKAAAAAVGVGALAACQPAAPPAPAPKPAAGETKATAAPAAAAATAAPKAAPASSEAVKLNFVCDTINTGHVQVRDKWCKQFNELHPNVTVEHQPVPQDYNTKIQTLFAAGSPPDTYRYLQEVVPIITVVAKNMHLRLDDWMKKDNYDLNDFRKDAANLYVWEGGTYGLPRDYGHQNLFLNLDLLSKAGLEPPPVDWTETGFTFQKFLEMAQKLTVKKGDKTEQWGFLVNRGWRPWASWVYNNGGTVVKRDAKGVATEIALTEPVAVEALQFLQDLMYKQGVAPRPDIESEMGGFELFASGRVGMMINNPSAVNQYRTIQAFKWDIATLPLGKASKRGTGGGGSGWAAGATTKSPQWAWEFLKYISTAQGQQDEVAVGATTPSRVSVVTSPQFLDPNKPPANAKGFAQAQEYVVRDPVNVRWPEVFNRIVTPNMDQLWSGAKTAAEVTKTIKAEADPLLAKG